MNVRSTNRSARERLRQRLGAIDNGRSDTKSMILACAIAVSQQASPAPDEGGWRPYDRVVVCINEDVITYRELARGLEQLGRNRPLNTEAERRRAEAEILDRSIRERLAAQAGEDLGFDPQVVEARVQENLGRLIERHNGIAGMAKFLESQDLTSREARDVVRDKLYSDLWEATLTGEGAGPGARPEQDPFLRPGLLDFHFRNAISDSRVLEQLGGSPQRVVLQTLFLAADDARGPQATQTLAEDLRQRIVSGEDMSDVVAQYSIAPKDRGISDPVEEEQIAKVDPRIAEFVARAKPGDLSPVETIVRENRTYWRIVKLVERQPAVVPKITTHAVQKRIAEAARRQTDDYRLGRGYRAMFEASYVWPPEYAKKP